VQTWDRILPPEATEQVSEGSEARIQWVENRHFYTKMRVHTPSHCIDGNCVLRLRVAI
jgi:hypothetical protein